MIIGDEKYRVIKKELDRIAELGILQNVNIYKVYIPTVNIYVCKACRNEEECGIDIKFQENLNSYIRFWKRKKPHYQIQIIQFEEFFELASNDVKKAIAYNLDLWKNL